jgi:hypothetical protein
MRVSISVLVPMLIGLVFSMPGCGGRESQSNSCNAACACANAKRLCSSYNDAKCMYNTSAATEGVRVCVSQASSCDVAEACFRVDGSVPAG